MPYADNIIMKGMKGLLNLVSPCTKATRLKVPNIGINKGRKPCCHCLLITI